MTYVHRTLIVPAALAPQAASLCTQLAGPAGAGMFTTGLSATGAAPATHYVSSGKIEDTFAAVLSDPAVMQATCQKAGISVTLASCQALLGGSDVSEEKPFDAMARLGLKMISEGQP